MSVVDLKQADAAVDEIALRMFKASNLGLLSAAMLGVQRIVTRIIPSRSPTPVDRGVFRAGWRAYGEVDGAVIENLEPSAILIEEGVRAANVKIGRLMLTALELWIVRKGIASAAAAPKVAWAIAKNMQKRGVFGGGQGLGILRELIEKDLPQLMHDEIAREIKREFA